MKKLIILAMAVLLLVCSCSMFEPEVKEEPTPVGTWRKITQVENTASSWTETETLVITQSTVTATTTYKDVVWWDSSAKRHRQPTLEAEMAATVDKTVTNVKILPGVFIILDEKGEPVSSASYALDGDYIYLISPLSTTRFQKVK